MATVEYDYWREATKPRFWEEILEQRATLLDSIAGHLEAVSPHDLTPLQSVKAAQQRCAELAPAEFVSFTEKWLERLTVWRSLLSQFSHADSVGKALAELGLSHAVRMYEGNAAGVPAMMSPETGKARPRSTQVRFLRSALILMSWVKQRGAYVLARAGNSGTASLSHDGQRVMTWVFDSVGSKMAAVRAAVSSAH